MKPETLVGRLRHLQGILAAYGDRYHEMVLGDAIEAVVNYQQLLQGGKGDESAGEGGRNLDQTGDSGGPAG